MPPEIIPAAAEESAASTVVSALLFVAFIGLFMLTVGVIYLAVQDFLQKRERDKFEKEEAEKTKKGGKKQRPRRGLGPEGLARKLKKMKNKHDICDLVCICGKLQPEIKKL